MLLPVSTYIRGPMLQAAEYAFGLDGTIQKGAGEGQLKGQLINVLMSVAKGLDCDRPVKTPEVSDHETPQKLLGLDGNLGRAEALSRRPEAGQWRKVFLGTKRRFAGDKPMALLSLCWPVLPRQLLSPARRREWKKEKVKDSALF